MTSSTITVDADTGEVLGDLRLFDIPALDGHRADTLRLAFAGSVDIDPMLDDDLEHFNTLRFGQEVELRVTGTVGKTGWTLKVDSEGNETVTHTLSIVVHSYQAD